jgi:hypothetical protein
MAVRLTRREIFSAYPLTARRRLWYHVRVFGSQEVMSLPEIESRNPKTRFARFVWV